MNRYKTSHPDAECLLQYADGELSSRNAAHVRAHLEACWRCRAEIEDLQETITDYVRYEQTIFGSPPDARVPWDAFGIRLERLITDRQNRPSHRSIALVKTLLSNRRILSAALAAVVVVCFVVVELKHPPSVSAAELLQKASEKEGRVAHHPRIRIKTRGRTFVRAAIMAANHGSENDVETELRSLFVDAKYGWKDPLSAVSYAAWRDRLPDRYDEVVLQGNRDAGLYQVRTSTRSSSLEEATLNLRAKDLGVVSGTFRFRSSEWVEMTALPDEPSPLSEQTTAEPRHAPASTAPALDRQPSREPTGPAEELRVIAALHSADADLGDQIELSRDNAGRLIVTATGIAPRRRAALQSSLSTLPEVSLRFKEPRIDLSKPTQAESSQSRSPSPDTTDALQLKLQETLGGAAALARFTDQVLETSEAAIVQVHDLRKLAERFSPGVELQFELNDHTILAQLRRDHAQALAAIAASLHGLLAPVLISLGARDSQRIEGPPNSPTWQGATEVLFSATQRLDRLLTTLLAGAGADHPAEAVAETDRALKQLRVDIDWYQSLVGSEEKRRY